MILSAGEALIDMLPRETRDGEAAFAPHAGGAVYNTAIALGRLGAPSAFFSGLSTDLFGAILTDGAVQGVLHRHLHAVQAVPLAVDTRTEFPGAAGIAGQ